MLRHLESFKSYNGFQRNFSHQDAVAPYDFELCAVHNLILQDFLCQHFPRGLYGLNTSTLVARQYRTLRIQRETVSVPDVEKIPWHRIILISSNNQLPLIVLVPLAESAMGVLRRTDRPRERNIGGSLDCPVQTGYPTPISFRLAAPLRPFGTKPGIIDFAC